MSRRWARMTCLVLLAVGRRAPAQWTPADSHTLASLRGVAVAGDSILWASGAQGTVLVSSDLGQHWTARPVAGAGSSDFRGIAGFAGRTVCATVAAQDTARIYRTTDGGAAWTLRYDVVRRGAFLDGVAAWDGRRGLAIGDPIAGHFVVVTTDDACGRWSEVHPDRLPNALVGEVIFAASNTALVTRRGGRAWIATGGTRARVLRTADYGVTWRVSDVPLVGGGGASTRARSRSRSRTMVMASSWAAITARATRNGATSR